MHPIQTIRSLALLVALLSWLIILPRPLSFSMGHGLFARAELATESYSSQKKKSSFESSSCFVGSSGCSQPRRHQLGVEPRLPTVMNMQSSSITDNNDVSSSSIMDTTTNGEFNLQKARLMARFSSVAYEDPPKNSKRGKMAQIEQVTDSYGVTISRPAQSDEYMGVVKSGGENESMWDMAHLNAMSPRPLMPMLSECNMAGLSGIDDDIINQSQFEWVALATNKKTSAQFDVWRITSSSASKSVEAQKSSNTLVIAFRGTRLSSYLDLLTDIQLKQDMISCSELGVCMDRSDSKGEVNGNGSEDGVQNMLMAHSGFFRAYSSIRPTLLQLLSDNIGTYDHLWFTGHSLGASLATLAVVDVGSLMKDTVNPITIQSMSSSSSSSPPFELTLDLPKARISSYIFGTPRVGNLEFTKRLTQLQREPGSIVQEYFRINTTGDAIPYLPRGKVVNRLDIDYVHAGASVFLPSLSTENQDGKNDEAKNNNLLDDMLEDETNDAVTTQAKMDESYSRWMMQLEEDTIEQINSRIFQSDNRDTGTNTGSTDTSKKNISTKIRIYPKGDQPPDPLSEVDPQYNGFFPFNPRTWISSKSFQNFLLGEAVRSFRILRGGFVKNHQLKTYEDGLCLASQDNVIQINPLNTSYD